MLTIPQDVKARISKWATFIAIYFLGMLFIRSRFLSGLWWYSLLYFIAYLAVIDKIRERLDLKMVHLRFVFGSVSIVGLAFSIYCSIIGGVSLGLLLLAVTLLLSLNFYSRITLMNRLKGRDT